MPPLEIRHSRLKMFWLFLGSMIFVFLGVWMSLKPETFTNGRNDWLNPYIAGACVIFFGFGSIVSMLQMFSSKVQIRVDEKGIYAGKLSEETIPWAAIQDLGIGEIKIAASRQVFAIMKMSEEDENQVRFKRIYKMSKNANKSFGVDGPHFVLNGMNGKPRLLAEEIVKRYNHYKGLS